MPNLIDSCGRDWFNRRVQGATFLYNNQVVQLGMCGNNDHVMASDVNDGRPVAIPKEFFTGFGVFAYPQLGYRKRGKNGLATHITRKHTYDRGLREGVLRSSWSPFSFYYMHNTPAAKRGLVGAASLLDSVFKPEWDNKDGVRAMLDGKQIAAVLNADLLIEPSIVNEHFDVFYKTRQIGTLNPDGVFNFPHQDHKKLVEATMGGLRV